MLLKAEIILLFLFSTCVTVSIVSAEEGGYIVTPSTGEDPKGALVDRSEADANITFWDYPCGFRFLLLAGC